MKVVRDPAVAVAISKCWLGRWSKRATGTDRLIPGLSELHPDRCNFCDMPTDELIQMLSEFLDWAGMRPDAESSDFRPSIEAFLLLPPEEQKRLVYAEQYG